MNWKDELKDIKISNTKKPDLNMAFTSQFKATNEVKKFIGVILEKFNNAKSILESDHTEVEIEKANHEKSRYICSLSVRSAKHENFKYTLILEVKNEITFVISKQYIEGWVINGPIEVKKVNTSSNWNQNSINTLANIAMDDLTNTYKLVCEYIK